MIAIDSGKKKYQEGLFFFLLIVLVFYFNYNYIINHFFSKGAYLFDSGFFAGLVYHNPCLEVPAAVGNGNYYSIHFAPLLTLFSLLSYLTPLALPWYYAVTQGVVYSVVAIAGYYSFSFLIEKRDFRSLLFLGFFSSLFVYNGIGINSINYPHFELIFSGLGLLFFIFFIKSRYLAASVFFIFALLTREDGGFHLFGFLFLLYCVSFVEKDLRVKKTYILSFALVSFFYSLLSLGFQYIFFEGTSTLQNVYLGNPVFAHLNAEFFQERSLILLTKASHVVFPWLGILFSAFYLRSFSFSIGFFAVFPWFLIKVLAVRDTAGSLFSYYAFPFIIAFGWPSIWFLLKGSSESLRKKILFIQVTILLISLFTGIAFHRGVYYNVFFKSLRQSSFSQNDYYKLEGLNSELSKDIAVVYDHSVLSMYPHKLGKAVQFSKNRVEGDTCLMGFYNNYGYKKALDYSKRNKLNFVYDNRKLPLYLRCNKELSLQADRWIKH